jgi:hypothetical protein
VEVVRSTGVVLEVENTGNTVESALVQGVQGCRHADVRGYVLVMMHAVYGYEACNGQVPGNFLVQRAYMGWKNNHDGRPCKSIIMKGVWSIN